MSFSLIYSISPWLSKLKLRAWSINYLPIFCVFVEFIWTILPSHTLSSSSNQKVEKGHKTLELITGFEPVTSSLPRKCSANWATSATKKHQKHIKITTTRQIATNTASKDASQLAPTATLPNRKQVFTQNTLASGGPKTTNHNNTSKRASKNENAPGADGRTWTGTVSLPRDFKSLVSTYSTTSAKNSKDFKSFESTAPAVQAEHNSDSILTQQKTIVNRNIFESLQKWREP